MLSLPQQEGSKELVEYFIQATVLIGRNSQ